MKNFPRKFEGRKNFSPTSSPDSFAQRERKREKPISAFDKLGTLKSQFIIPFVPAATFPGNIRAYTFKTSNRGGIYVKIRAGHYILHSGEREISI